MPRYGLWCWKTSCKVGNLPQKMFYLHQMQAPTGCRRLYQRSRQWYLLCLLLQGKWRFKIRENRILKWFSTLLISEPSKNFQRNFLSYVFLGGRIFDWNQSIQKMLLYVTLYFLKKKTLCSTLKFVKTGSL